MGFDMHTVQDVRTPPPAYVPQYPNDPGTYGFRSSGMVVMVAVMEMAGVLADDAAPVFPPWPPRGVAESRADVLQGEISGKESEGQVNLTSNERKLVEQWRTLLGTRSKRAGTVPAFKFRSNDAWTVVPEECCAIARGLRALAQRMDMSTLRRLEKEYAEAQRRLLSAVPVGEVILQGNPQLGLTLDELKAWVLEWAAFNALAADHGGYRVR